MTTAAVAFQTMFERLSEDSRAALARTATQRARDLGLVVVKPTGDIDIPLTLTPVIIEESATRQRGVDAANVLSALVKCARAVLGGGLDSPRVKLLFAHFGPLERRALANWKRAEDVTIARIDWFIDEGGQHRALEVNATIPAMESYSDSAARAWIETLGAHAGLPPQRVQELVALNGSNAEELRRSILAHSAHTGDAPATIAIIHRAADSQLRELEALGRHFTAKGHRVIIATPDRLHLDSADRVLVDDVRPDILYRHIFARRMPENSVLEELALARGTPKLQNPVNGHLEVKGLLGELHRIVTEEDGAWLGLTEAEAETVKRIVPWTRVLSRDPCVTPGGTKAADLATFVESAPAAFVLKKSWDYGGKSVLLGVDVEATEGAVGWRRRVREALADGPGAWVVQAYVKSPKTRHLVVSGGGTGTEWADVYVDASTYTATGTVDVPGGGVTRWARVGVVNIVGGGGVAPLINAAVAEEIATALAVS